MGAGQPSFSRSELIALLRRASGVINRKEGIEYLQLSKELAGTADWLAHIGRIGPPPPGMALETWARLSSADKKAMIARAVHFAEFNENKVIRMCRACGSDRVEIVDVEEPPPQPARDDG